MDQNSEVDEEEVTVCEWYGYDKKRCKRESRGKKFCKIHNVLIKDYSIIKDDEDDDSMCCLNRDIKIKPRSKKHIDMIMKELNYNENMVEVSMSGGSIEEGDITSDDYILLTSDETCYYYEPEKGQLKASSLRIIFV
jgi:hypothetical protein